MNTIPTKNFFKDGIYIIRGLKDTEGNIYTYVRTINKNNITKVNIGDRTTVSEFEPVPYSEYTSLDDDYTKGYERTYIKVKLENNLTSKQINGLSTSGIMYYQFGEREVTILNEFKKPFQYTLNYLNSGEGKFGVYGPTTWLIHDKTRGEEERQAMEEILRVAHEHYKTTPYSLDISLDSNTLQYISYLRSLDDSNKITYGRGGFVRINKEDIVNGDREGYLNKEDLLYLAKKLMYTGVLFYHSLFTVEFYKEYILDTSLEQYFTTYLYDNEMADAFDSGFDMGYLAERNIEKLLEESTFEGYGEYETNLELVSDINYQPMTGTYDPYEYYCCYDCDGYHIDTADKPYDYQVDEQVELLSKIIDQWGDHLNDSHLILFRDWSPDIFNRYIESNSLSRFVKELINLN